MSQQTPIHAEATNWLPTSWQQRVALQQPHYEDAVELSQATTQLAQLPPLVTSWEVLALKQSLASLVRILEIGSSPGEGTAELTLKFVGRHQVVPFMMAGWWVRWKAARSQ